MIVATIATALLGVCLIAFLKVDLERAKKGGKSKFWEVKK